MLFRVGPLGLYGGEEDVFTVESDAREVDSREDLENVCRAVDREVLDGDGGFGPGPEQGRRAFGDGRQIARRKIVRETFVDLVQEGDGAFRLGFKGTRAGEHVACVLCGRPRVKTREVDEVLARLGRLRCANIVGSPDDVVEGAALVRASGGDVFRDPGLEHIQVEAPELPLFREDRNQRVDPLLPVEKLPRAGGRTLRTSGAIVFDQDMTALTDAADEERADRIASKQAIQQVRDPDLIPEEVPLDEGKAPRIDWVEAAGDQLRDGPRLDEAVEPVVVGT